MFVPAKPFQPSLMFAGKAGASLSEAPIRCFTLCHYAEVILMRVPFFYFNAECYYAESHYAEFHYAEYR